MQIACNLLQRAFLAHTLPPSQLQVTEYA